MSEKAVQVTVRGVHLAAAPSVAELAVKVSEMEIPDLSEVGVDPLGKQDLRVVMDQRQATSTPTMDEVMTLLAVICARLGIGEEAQLIEGELDELGEALLERARRHVRRPYEGGLMAVPTDLDLEKLDELLRGGERRTGKLETAAPFKRVPRPPYRRPKRTHARPSKKRKPHRPRRPKGRRR